MDSVRKQWAQQRKGVSQATSSQSGSHFASASNSVPASPSSAGDRAGAGRRPSKATTSVAMPSAQSGGRAPYQDKRQLKIVGASGEMPAVRVRVRRSEALPYSRYNKRYVCDAPSASERRGEGPSALDLFRAEPVEGVPVYSWMPYLAYGAASALLPLVWLVVVRFALSAQPQAGDVSMTVGVLLLCAIVLSGIVLVACTALQSKKNDDMPTGDAMTLALGKTAPMMVAGTGVWVLSMALSTSAAA